MMSPKSKRDHSFSHSKPFNGLPSPFVTPATKVLHVLGPHHVSCFTATTLPLCSLCSRLMDLPQPILLEHSKLEGSQSLCHCLKHFFYISPNLSFSSSSLCSNDTYQRPFLPTPYKMPYSVYNNICFPLKSFFFRALLSISYLTCLFIISFPL